MGKERSSGSIGSVAETVILWWSFIWVPIHLSVSFGLICSPILYAQDVFQLSAHSPSL